MDCDFMIEIPFSKYVKLISPRLTVLINTLDKKGKLNSSPYSWIFPLSFAQPADLTDYAPDGTLYCFVEYERCETAFRNIVKDFDKL